MNTIEQVILAKVSQLEIDQQRRVLAFLEQLGSLLQHYSARDLMRLLSAERNAILQDQLALSVNEDFEMFEAYSEEDIDAAI